MMNTTTLMLSVISLIAPVMTLMAFSESNHPLKMAVLMLCVVSMTMALMSNLMPLWMMMIYYMLFVGGILILFMILNSLSSNAKMNKMPNFYFFMILVFFTFLSTFMLKGNVEMNSQETMEMMKSYSLTIGPFFLVTFLVLMYFSFFVINFKEYNMSLRNFI